MKKIDLIEQIDKKVWWKYFNLEKEWDYEKNQILPSEVTHGSHKKYGWVCHKGHKWDSTIYHRLSGNNCPYCSNQKVLEGYNDLNTTHPNVAKEWDYEKNQNIKPTMIFSGSHKKYYWKCPNNHIYFTSVRSRTMLKTGCPYCSNLKALEGYNDVKTTHPQLLYFWDYEKNKVLPENFIFGSAQKIYWKFECGHHWHTNCTRFVQHMSCPYCNNRKILEGYNDLYTRQQDLIKEWNYEKNQLNPKKISEYCNKRVWWKCSNCGHEWEAVVSSRVYGTGCPKCNSEKNTSFGEQSIYYYFSKLDVDARNRFKIDNKYEIDIYLKKLNIGIEYDGYYFHKDKEETDTVKEKLLNEKGISIYRIIETKNKMDEPIIEQNKIIYQYDKGEKLGDAIKILFKIIGLKVNDDFINIIRDYDEINKSYEKSIKSNSVLNDINLIKEWDYEKNSPIRPETVARSSGKKFWWKCDKGHSYFNSPNIRQNGVGCPECAKENRINTLQKVLLKKNGTLADLNPEYIKEWNYEKNALPPDEYTVKSNKIVWWKCEKGHEWETSVYNRSQGKRCPYCTNRKVLTGYNDLKTLNPKLAKEFHPSKNIKQATEVLPTSNSKYWWKCSNCGHEWEAIMRLRNSGTRCPNCSKKKTYQADQ